MLLSIAYFPPVSYFALMATDLVLSPEGATPSVVYIEACETYRKQTWRNRCRIYAASGPEYLNFPVVHEEGTHELPITEIKVDYSTPWLIRTLRAIASAYESSGYFDYYKDELFSILESKPKTLFELDMQIIRFFLRKTGIPVDIRLTEEFTKPGTGPHPVYGEDYREVIHPKKEDGVLGALGLEKPYFQVFSGKYGFVPNLSIMDLLFNEGPASAAYLVRTSSRR